ncbi:MAG: phosphatase [Epulopiscium sp. Nele67-Bin005]|nr:MAG: phosphatase [Epulopiscium sp. Nele67-Bin005]
MEFYTDLHVHTVSSGHAYSTIDENLRVASSIGLKILGISDHTEGLPWGAGLYHFNNMKILPREKYGVTLLRGAETNIVDYNGTIDIPESSTRSLDYIIASLHVPCIEPNSDKALVTRGIIGAMENPLVKIIGHPGDTQYPMDFEILAKKSRETNTLLELNNSSLKPTSSRKGAVENLTEMLKVCNKHDLPIILNTDAHWADEVGDFTEATKLVEAVGFPKDLIINTQPEKLLEFLNVDLSK